MNKDETNLTAEQLAYLMAANQQLFAAAAAAASQNLAKPSATFETTPLTPHHLQNNMMMSWLAGLSAFQALQKPQVMDDQQLPYSTAAPSQPSTNALFEQRGPHGPSEPTYVNAKQYFRILKRREARKVLEAYFARTRRAREEKPYMHESRHKHALRRLRGSSGRFLTKSEIEQLKRESSTTCDDEMPPFKKRQCESAL
ncbi:nuclear transcription factor Y, alpha [Fistulifera solaris]|uniref:Nuclear transcription factor Y subunit n=1 Tax=Fistulifera solaris TaxID=1519565 RepID=A0A1Z5KIP5_FISSO|nr:nuclear transcription factor Y, alpha [Fistulifera solaris]|eukprot:GAX26174.1 nuclear transcription factor Y, alpha [Fistulifera solaris]